MIDRGPASENEVVLAFLQAEIDSSKRKEQYAHFLRVRGLDRASLIDNADLTDEQANRARAAIIDDVRGFGRRVWLFQGFPTDTAWRRVLVEAADYDRLKCISNDDQWDTLTRGTRLIREAARNFAVDPDAPIVRAIMQAVRQGSALIIVQVDNDLVLVEGTKRATAYAALGHQPFEAFLGTSSSMGNWTFGRDQSREPTGGSESGH